ncbi:MAG: PhoU domain-containing protein [Candidatus Bipolaricaulaceae bacterium]
MYPRKVQVTGGGTYFVTLPKAWAEEMGVEHGSTITLIPTEAGTLLFVPQEIRARNRCSIPMDDRDMIHLERDIIARYIAGYDVIEVSGRRIRPEQRRKVREVAQSLVGVEILEETHGTMVLHSVVNVQDFPVHQSIHRIFDITMAMLADAVTAFLTQDEELGRDVIERDGDVDRLVLLVARQFSLLLRDLLSESEAGMSRFQSLYYHTVADQLERVADHGAKISQGALGLRADLLPAVAERVQALHKESESVLVGAVQAFEAADTKGANRVLAGKEDRKRLLELAQISAADQPQNAPPISIVMDSLLRAREYGFNIAEVALDAAVARSCPDNS